MATCYVMPSGNDEELVISFVQKARANSKLRRSEPHFQMHNRIFNSGHSDLGEWFWIGAGIGF